MKSIIFALLVGCGNKTETTPTTSTSSTTTNAEADKTETVIKDDVQIISVENQGPKTNSGSI